MKLVDIVEVDIVEGVNDYVVYHNFTLNDKTEPAVAEVLAGGPLKARTANRINNLHNTRLADNNIEDTKSGQMMQGTSFTRNKRLAMEGEFGELCYEVDLRKIKETNKVVPIDDLTDAPHHDLLDIKTRTAQNMGLRTESEEFVIGDIPRFVVAIKKIHYLGEGSTKKGFDRKVEQVLASFKKQHPHIEIVDHYASQRKAQAKQARIKKPNESAKEIVQLRDKFMEAKARFEEIKHDMHPLIARSRTGSIEYLQQMFTDIDNLSAKAAQKALSRMRVDIDFLHQAMFK
jgi:hypothetical protein